MLHSYLFNKRHLCIFTLVGVFYASLARGEETFTLADALAQALQKNPSLQVHAYGARLAEARILQAGVRPNPRLFVEFENFLGTGELSGIKRLDTTVQLSQVIDLAGSIENRVASANASLAVTHADYEAKRIDVFAEVAQRFIESAAERLQLDNAREARKLNEQTVEAVQARVEVGQTTVMELNKARIELALSLVEEEHVEHELAAARQSLAALLGDEEPSFGTISADLMTFPEVPDFPDLITRLEESPVLARYSVEARWREAQIRLQESLRQTGPLVSGGLRRVEATDDFGLVASVSLPLPVRDQSLGRVREVRELRDQVDARAKTTRLEMVTTLFEVYQEMKHKRLVLTQLQDEIIPLAEENLSLSRDGYNKGRYSLRDMQEAQRSLIGLRKRHLENATAYHLFVIEIERLLGAPLMTEVARS